MKKSYLFLAAAAMTLASCSNDDFLGGVFSNEEKTAEITFSSSSPNMTRADYTGADAAAKLGGYFTVSGTKGESSIGANTVFDNYRIQWGENTANTTESNTNNWEYVGVSPIAHATANGISSQTIKYWDYTQAQYDFIAWSTGSKTAVYSGTPASGEVLVSAITPSTATGASGTAYTMTGSAADLSQCYIADLVTVTKASGNYGKPVTLTFRQLGTKVRIAIYETVPGYSVKDVQFYSAAASDDAQATTAKLFTTTANTIYTNGTYTVYYPTVNGASSVVSVVPADGVDVPTTYYTDQACTTLVTSGTKGDGSTTYYNKIDAATDNNQAHVKFAGSGDQSTTITWGALNYTIAEQGEKTTGSVFLGRSSNTASYAGSAADNYYTVYLPNESGTNLNLRVNYTLESIDGSAETITVKGATAQVPSIYTTWKSGYAYTYIFKISDKTNGTTGVYDPTKPDDTSVNSDPAGLYPITFDAVVVNAEDNDNVQETITTVSAPSITTYQEGHNVVNDNEYPTGKDIYVTVNDGNTANTPDLANGALVTLTGKAALYTVAPTTTEASVVDALSMQEDHPATGVTIQGRNGVKLTTATLTLTDKVEYGADGNAISVGKDKAAKFTPATGTYAFVYTKTASTSTEDKYQAKTFTVGDAVKDYYRYDYKAATTSDVQKGVKYFKETSGVYAMQTVFLGQGVSNLYLDADGNSIASGYAKTGTTYYYTVNKGQSYKAAHNVAYADFGEATLYTLDGTTYKAKTDTTPVDGTAYYYKESDGSYTYCVILPQQTTDMYELDTTKYVACTDSEVAIDGQVYFDKYTKNNGVYYVKVIKVQ